MALLSDIAPVTINPALNLFEITPHNVSESDAFFVEYFPINPDFSNLHPVEFYVPGSDLAYIDLAKSRIFVTLNITKGDEKLKFTSRLESDLTDPAKSSIVALINNPLHSLFTSVELFLNDQLLTSPSLNSYPYLSYLQKILNNGNSVKNGKLTGAGFYLDTSFTDVKKNKGFLKRLELTADTNDLELWDTLDIDAMSQFKYLINAVNVKLRLNRSSNNFALQKATDDPTNNYKINIKSIKLVLRKIIPHENILVAHNQLLNKHNAVYDYQRLVFRHFNIPTGNTNFVLENIYQGYLPSRLFCMMVDTNHFQGTLTSNPFYFKHNNLSHLSLFVDSTPLLDQKFNFTNGAKYIEAFSNLYFHSGFSAPTEGDIEITRDQFQAGFCIFCYDSSTDLSAGDYSTVNRTGNLRLSLDFAEALSGPTTLIVIGVFNNMYTINKERQVVHDFRL